MKNIKTLLLTAVACGGAMVAAPAQAADFSFTGNFVQDDNVQLFNFVVGAASNVTLRTWSYAGGVNAAGAAIARGGFDPILALFDSTGALVGQNDDGGCANVAADLGGQCWDTFFTAALAPGNYTVSVMQYNNFATGPNLANGFARAGQGNFTPGFSGCPSNQNAFEDVSGDAYCARDNHWAFDILNVEGATQTPAVPEPATWAMLILGFGAVGASLRARRRGAKARIAFG